MENSDNLDTKSYSKAANVEYSAVDQLSFFFYFLAIFLRVVSIMIQEAFANLLILIIGQKPKDISGQLALVTGGANGLGRAMAFRFAQEGCNVVIVDLFLKEAQQVASEITKKFNVKASAYKVDVSDFEAIQKLKGEIEKSLGTVDILVNNAAVLTKFSFRGGQPNDIQNIINVNLTAHFWVDLIMICFSREIESFFADGSNFSEQNDRAKTRSHCGNLVTWRKSIISDGL
jgi:hypothetical protein